MHRPVPTPTLDFDGDYGRTYATTIRRSVPAYDTLLEISAAALQPWAPTARQVLVVGPGPGEELVGLLEVLPEAHLTVLEPSEQMAQACRAVIERHGAGDRCSLLQQQLNGDTSLAEQGFDVVVSHNVAHLMPPEPQQRFVQDLADRVAPGGALLLSSYSEPADQADLDTMLSVAASRLRRLGLDGDALEAFLATRNTLVFSLDGERLVSTLVAAGLQPPQLLLMALGSRLWLSRRG